jgi:hypothetical protein
MIRVFVFCIALVLGLGLAAITQGRVQHLRVIADDKIPEGVKMLDPDSGLLFGTAPNAIAKAEAKWRFVGLAFNGLRYQLRLTGSGVAVRMNVTLAWDGHSVHISEAQGDLDIAQSYKFAQQIDLSGTLYIDNLTGIVDHADRHIISLSGQAVLREARLDGTDISDLTIYMNTDAAGDWLAELDSPEGALQLSANARGRYDQSTFQIEGLILDNPEMQESWQRKLNQKLPKTAAGWQINQPFDLRNPVVGQ